MKLPWNSDELDKKQAEIEKLEKQISDLEDQKNSWKNRFESEKERRKVLSRKKQDAEEQLNRLKDKLRNSGTQEKQTEEKQSHQKFESISFGKTNSLLRKLDSIESGEKDLVTVYCPEDLDDLEDLRGLKNSVSAKQFSKLQDIESFVAFLDQDTGNTVLKLSPFFKSKFVVEEFFDIADLLEFFNSEKHWVLVSAGKTKVLREESGRVEEVESVKSRVDREHSKGGFSQGRFERKRDEQIEKHVKQVKQVLEDFDEESLYVLGDKKLCDELPGSYLGGFDPNRKKPEQFYQFQLYRN
jgi:hypothetical protein